jgi:hypothetical protein
MRNCRKAAAAEIPNKVANRIMKADRLSPTNAAFNLRSNSSVPSNCTGQHRIRNPVSAQCDVHLEKGRTDTF